MAREDTQFKKGHSRGRPRGSKNKVKQSIREALKGFLEDKRPDVEKAFDKLQPRHKVAAFTRLLPFVTPQYSAINFSLRQMSTDDLQFLLEQLKQSANDDD